MNSNATHNTHNPLTGDGVVDGADLAGILGNWGVLEF